MLTLKIVTASNFFSRSKCAWAETVIDENFQLKAHGQQRSSRGKRRLRACSTPPSTPIEGVRRAKRLQLAGNSTTDARLSALPQQKLSFHCTNTIPRDPGELQVTRSLSPVSYLPPARLVVQLQICLALSAQRAQSSASAAAASNSRPEPHRSNDITRIPDSIPTQQQWPPRVSRSRTTSAVVATFVNQRPRSRSRSQRLGGLNRKHPKFKSKCETQALILRELEEHGATHCTPPTHHLLQLLPPDQLIQHQSPGYA